MTAFMAAFIQACTAVAIVSALLLVVGAASSMARNLARWLKALSFLLISGLGFWLIWQAVRGPVTRLVRLPAKLVSVPALAIATHSHSVNVHHHHHHHHHHHQGGDCACGHAHLPSASAVEEIGRFGRPSRSRWPLESGHAPGLCSFSCSPAPRVFIGPESFRPSSWRSAQPLPCPPLPLSLLVLAMLHWR